MPYHFSATLPQELIDLIVEQLGLEGDTRSLIACLTVSKAFFPMARACLWRDRFLGIYRNSSQGGHVKESLDKIPECSILRSLVRSMRLCDESWSFEDMGQFLQDLSAVVDAFKRVNRIEMVLCEVLRQVPISPVIAQWHIVSLKVSYLGVGRQGVTGVAATSCAFFENFPFLIDVELDHPISIQDEEPVCTTQRHHKLPQTVSLTLRRAYSDDCSRIHSSIAAGHLLSSKKLRTVNVDCTAQLDVLLASTSDTVKNLVVHPWYKPVSLFSFHHAEAILFSLDTKRTARDTLLWWTRVMVKNKSNNTVQKVTIEIQLHLEPERTAPRICFPTVWTEFGTALSGLLALKELVIIHQPGCMERIGNKDDVATRAKVTKFLRGKLSAVVDPARVRLVFIDRNG